jgi:hypothetical protein
MYEIAVASLSLCLNWPVYFIAHNPDNDNELLLRPQPALCCLTCAVCDRRMCVMEAPLFLRRRRWFLSEASLSRLTRSIQPDER